MLGAIALLLLQTASTAGGFAPIIVAPAVSEDADAAVIARVHSAAQAGRPAEMLALLDPLLAKLDAAAAAEKRRTYSGQTLPMTLLNMGFASKDKVGAVDVGPSYGEAAYFKGYALMELGRPSEAGPFYERALALSPANATYHTEYGFWLRKRGQLDAAMAHYKEAEAWSGLAENEAVAKRAKAAALRGQGYVLIDLDRLDEAEARYRESLQLDPGNPFATADLAFIAKRRIKPPKNKT